MRKEIHSAALSDALLPMSAGLAWTGRSVSPRENLRFIRGQGRYLDDLVLPRMVYLGVVRSPLAHARVGAIRLEAARQVPGVLAVTTGRDLAGRFGPLPLNVPEDASLARVPHPVLSPEKVRYAGEPIAAVVAESREAVADAATLIDVAYDPLPAVTEPEEALRGGIRLHEELEGNVLLRWRRTAGDVEGAMRAADRIVRERFRIPRLVAAPMEPRGAVAAYDPGIDLLTVWCSTQDPHRPLAQLSRLLGRPEERIRVVVPDVGGAFGSKGAVPMEGVLAAYFAMKLGRPIKWIETRRENFLASYQGRGMTADVELAVERSGRITALRARLIADLGAYLYPATGTVPLTAAMLLTGVYAIPAADVELLGVATNKAPTGPYRGAGRPEACFIIERMVDRVGRDLDIDPIEVRRRNLIPADRFPYRTPLGFIYDSGDYPAALARALQILDYDAQREEQRRARTQGRVVGIGVAMYVERAGTLLWESAAVSVGPSGRVVVKMGSTPQGQGHETTFSQIAADALGVDLEAIAVEHGDSAVVPRGVGTFGSRSTTVGGSALLVALEKIQTKAIQIAAHLLEAAPEDIQRDHDRYTVRGAPSRAVTFQQIAAAAYQPGRLPREIEMGLSALGVFTLPGPVFPSGAYAAVVEIRPDNGEVHIRKVVAVDDAGRIVNPLLAEGQVLGGIVQGLGETLVEEAVYDDTGQLVTGTFADYGIPKAVHAPTVVSEFMETPSPWNPLGAKGIGEAGAIATPPALANAVMDALAPFGVQHIDLPITPEKLWRLLRNRGL